MKQGRGPFKTIQKKPQTQGRPTPVAPPAYRPMPTPLVLQRKLAVAGPNANKPLAPVKPTQLTVPHVLQRKEIARPQAPPVPVKPNPLVQRKQQAPPRISRPAILQPKVIQRAKWSFGQSDDDMSNQQWAKSGMVTYASIMVDDGDEALAFIGLGKSNKTVRFGREHAEDVSMRVLLDTYTEEELNGLNIILNLSKSPCSSKFGTSGDKDPGCAENLVAFAKAYGCNISIICRGLYKGAEGSQQAVDWLRSKGIAVSVDVRLGREKRFGEEG